MSHVQQVTFQWISSILAVIVIAIAGGWASHVNSQLERITERLTRIEVRLGVSALHD